jgi:hypothetical protein
MFSRVVESICRLYWGIAILELYYRSKERLRISRLVVKNMRRRGERYEV